MKKLSIRDFTASHIERVKNTIMSLPWEKREVYGDLLAQTYYHICHSTRLLAAAAARFPVSREELHQQCLKHASEERSHEKLSLSDLEVLGFQLSDFSELPSTKSLYRSAYYLIEHEGPIALFGYAYFLEWIAIAGGVPMHEVTERTFGKKAVKHLHVHTKEDPAHIESYEKKLETFSAVDRECIMESVATTAHEYERMYQEIMARSGAKQGHRAA